MKWKTMIGLLWATATLPACSRPSGQNDYCAIARPIYITPGDVLSDSTARQILDHDEDGKKICGWKGRGS